MLLVVDAVECRCLGTFIRHDGVAYKHAASAAAECSWRRALRQLGEGQAMDQL